MDVGEYAAARPLLRRASEPSPDGTLVEVAAPSPGWEYVEVAAYRLRAGQSIERAADDRERLVLVLEGRAAVCAGSSDFGVIGSRSLVFDGPPPPVVLVSPGDSVELVAQTDALVLVAAAPAGPVRRTACIAPGGVFVERPGSG